MSDATKSIPHRDEAAQSSNRAKTGETVDTAKEESVAEEPSGYRGENPSTAGPGDTGIRSRTPENARGTIDPSSPGETGTTPGSTPQE